MPTKLLPRGLHYFSEIHRDGPRSKLCTMPKAETRILPFQDIEPWSLEPDQMTTALSRHEPYFTILFVRGIRLCTKGLLVAIADEPELGLRNMFESGWSRPSTFPLPGQFSECKLITVICTPSLKSLYSYLLVDVPYFHTAQDESYKIIPCRDSYSRLQNWLHLLLQHKSSTCATFV
jgi:hypothetical protein